MSAADHVSADHPLVAAVKPLVDAMGGRMLLPGQAGDDVVLAWEGEDVLAVRLPQLADSLDHILAALERRHGMPLSDLDRKGKQEIVRSLEARGAGSRCGTAWRPWPAPSASVGSPSTTT